MVGVFFSVDYETFVCCIVDGACFGTLFMQ